VAFRSKKSKNIGMDELLEIYDLDNNLLRTQERRDFYKEIDNEYTNNGKITKKVRTIRLQLMNSNGQLYVQKRSNSKKYNSGLYDKTVGGHVLKGHTVDVTIAKECAEELGFPAVNLSDEEFNEAVQTTDLTVIGLFREVDLVDNFQSKRECDESAIIQPFITHFIVGYYDGSIRFSDGEASGVEVFSLEELKSDIKNNPDKFTEDLKFILKNYEQYLKPISEFKN
jgi:isopentenyldiphosphate isomerase